MAKQVIALEATLNSSPAEGSVKSLKAQLREAQAEVVKMSDKFGETSTQAAQAAQKAAQLKDRIGDAKALTEAFNPDKKFQAFSSAIQGVVGGFSALQGAQALFGAKSEDLEKTLVKVQGAMALSQGLSAITEAGDSFKNLKVVAVNALNSIKAAIGSTGIGLLVIALGAIYTYWDDIKGAVNGVSAEQEKLNAKTKANLDAQKQKLTTINSQDNILKLQGKSEKDILKLKMSQYDAVIKATEAQIIQSEITKNAQVKAAERNKEILKGLLNFLSIPITAILYAVDQVRNALGGTSTLLEDYKEGLAKMVFDPEQTKKDGEKEIQEQKNALQNLKNERAGFQLQIQAIDKGASDKTKAQNDKSAEDLKKANEDAQNQRRKLAEENALLSIKDERKRQEAALQIQFENQQLEIERSKANREEKDATLLELENNFLLQTAALRQKFADEDAQKKKEKDEKDIQAEKDLNDVMLQLEKQAAEESTKIAEDQAKAKVQFIQDIANATGALSDVIGKETAVGKGLAVAQATINTYLGASEVIKAKSVLPEPLGTISKVVNVATIIATGLKAVKGILSTKVPGGGGGGGNPSLPSPSTIAPVQPQLGQTALNQQMINATGNAAVRAFVLETDVSGNQERIKRLNRAARIN
jgi:hypothetical protein